MSATPQAGQPTGVSSTTSTVQAEQHVVKSKDPAWKYCICPDINKKNSLRCIYCHHVYTNGITRIKYHLACIPISGVNPCEKVPADVKQEILEPLANLLRRMDSDVPAMGFIYGAFLDAKQEISAKFKDGETCLQEVLHIVDKRWDKKLKGPLHRAGYFLNPYYYYENKLDIELDGSFKDGLVVCMEKMVRDSKKEDIMMEEIQAYQDEQGSFGRASAQRQRRNKDFDPAKWWSNHGSSAPNLRVLAMRILSLTCSSSACERNFSVFQQVLTKRRNILLHDKMRDLVFIKANSRLEQKRAMKNWDPIEVKVFADVVEDENNEWITGIVPVEVEHNVDEPESENVEVSTSHGTRAASKRKRASRPAKKKLIPIYRDDELQSVGSSSESDEDAMHSASSSSE